MMIELGNGKFAIIDESDYQLVMRFKWRVKRTAGHHEYAQAHGPRKKYARVSVLMHRLIMAAQPGQYVDHINGNGLDNRRANLRICTNAQNSWNTNYSRGRCKQRGVWFEKRTGKFAAAIRANGQSFWLGRFSTEREAAAAYIASAKILHGDFFRK